MSHFLARMVQRARGTSPRVEPVVAPRFAPAPIVEVASEVESRPQEGREQQLKTEEKSWPHKVVSRKFSAEKSETQPSREPEKLPPLAEVGAAEREPEKLLVPPEMVAADSTVVVRRSQATGPSAPLVKNGAMRKESLAPLPGKRPRSSSPLTTTWRDLEHGRVRPNESSDEPPIVRVTIGRIDVRATPPPVPARKSPPRSEPKLTLDAYLKSRREGAR